MKYMGSKNRIAKEILPIMLKNRKDGQYYIEPFVGGANIIDKVDGYRIGGDNNKYLIALLKHISIGGKLNKISKDEYIDIRKNKYNYDDWVVGYAGILASYSGKWFGGYAGVVNTKQGVRDYQEEAIKNVKKQNLDGIKFICASYSDIEIPQNSIIYCDPPYEGTTKYKTDFNHSKFWEWCREQKKNGHTIFVSEYNAPDDFKCVWEKEVKSSLSANGKSGGSKSSIEKLFTL